jgi:hypothetical protein
VRGRAQADAQGRCDGAGSEEIGGEPSVSRNMLAEGFAFSGFGLAPISLVEPWS